MSLIINIKKNLRKYEPFKFLVKNLFIKMGLMKGGNNYSKFVIIARSRTGSTLLEKYLDSHPNIQCEGELLNNLDGRNYKFIIDSFFKRKEKQIESAGFKMFYYHPNDGNPEEVWSYLLKDSNTKLIHLVRKNVLRTIVSQRVATKTKQWSIQNNGSKIPTESKIVHLDLDACMKEIVQTKEWESEFEALNTRFDYVEVSYEDLCSQPKQELVKIQNFLGVKEFENLNTAIKKQNVEPISKLVENYSALEAALKASPWESFLQE